MCGLCGLLGNTAHWSDPLDTGDGIPARQRRLSRLKSINQLLAHYRLTLSDFQGSAYLLSSPTGRQAMVGNLDDLWRQVAAMRRGRAADPLDPALLASLEAHWPEQDRAHA